MAPALIAVIGLIPHCAFSHCQFATMRLFSISDVHADEKENMRWIEQLPSQKEDAIIVAGDVSHDPELVSAESPHLSPLHSRYAACSDASKASTRRSSSLPGT